MSISPAFYDRRYPEMTPFLRKFIYMSGSPAALTGVADAVKNHGPERKKVEAYLDGLGHKN